MPKYIISFFVFLNFVNGLNASNLQMVIPKPYHNHHISTADLNTFPEIVNSDLPAGTEITIGDLHGNAQKLMYFLITNNTVNISKNDYTRFIRIYKKPVDLLTREDITDFDRLINNLEFKSNYKLRFLGDDLCDRGMNDYYMLRIFQAMDNAYVKFEVILSNHNKFFLEAYESDEQSFDNNPYGPGRYESVVSSMLNLGKIISRGLVSKQEVLNVVKNNYLKHLVLPGITINKAKKEITIYTHAPSDLQIIKDLGLSLGIDYKDNSLDNLAVSINQINGKIKSWILQRKLIANYNNMLLQHNEILQVSPLHQLLWNRDYSILNNENYIEERSYTVNYVHGHDSQPNMVNLDNMFGKGNNNDIGQYAVYMTS